MIRRLIIIAIALGVFSLSLAATALVIEHVYFGYGITPLFGLLTSIACCYHMWVLNMYYKQPPSKGEQA